MSKLHEKALKELNRYALSEYKNVISTFVYGSVGRGEVREFSDIDAIVLLATKESFLQKKFLISGDILLSITIFDLKTFTTTKLTGSWLESIKKAFTLDKIKIIYDPARCCRKIIKAFLRMQDTTNLRLETLNTFWSICVIYLGKLAEAAKAHNLAYAAECSSILASHVGRIILFINKKHLFSNYLLREQLSNCKIKTPDFMCDFDVLYSSTTNKVDLKKKEIHGLHLCQELQKLLYKHCKSKQIPELKTVLSSVSRNTVFKKLTKSILSKNTKDVLAIVAPSLKGKEDINIVCDVDVFVILAVKQKIVKREFFFDDQVMLSVLYYDLNSFITNSEDCWKNINKVISVHGKVAVLYDPTNCWGKIAKTIKVAQESYSSEYILNNLWALCIIYLGKLITSLTMGNFTYAAECSMMLAHNAAHIVLNINKVFPGSRESLRMQAISCNIKPKHFKKNFNVLYGICNAGSLKQKAVNGLCLCRELQKILYTHVDSEGMSTVNISFDRYVKLVMDLDCDE